MKKLSLFLFVLFKISFFAGAVWIGMVPWAGATNIFIGSEYFPGPSFDGESINFFTYAKDGEWTQNAGKEGYYTDKNMVALCSINDTNCTILNKKKATIEAVCSSGFNFVSQSSPSYIRPFDIYLVCRQAHVSGASYADYSFIKLKENQKTEIEVHKDYVWFDVVLVLPGKNTGSGVTVDQSLYPLIEKDDYSAIVTLKIDFEGKSMSLSLPFSGYYKASETGFGNEKQSISLSINTTTAASNLNIRQLAGYGSVHVATINMLNYKGTQSASPHKEDGVRIFFSASNDPYVSNPRGFEFVHSSVTGAETPTEYNSIGFSLRTTSYPQGKNIEIHGDGSNYSNQYDSVSQDIIVEFSGNEYIDNSFSLHGEYGSDYFVWPLLVQAHARQDIIDNKYFYYEWTGDVYLLMDSKDVIMMPGRYTAEVFIHVVDEGI